MQKDLLINSLKEKVIAALNLPGVSVDDLQADASLFGEDGLGLDSVDALELVVMLEKEFEIFIDDKVEVKKVFFSIDSIADFIIANKNSDV